jgi:5-methylcytosine-specific restriction endonuclease McrA
MNKELIEQYIANGISSYKIAELENKSQTSVRYWLDKYELKTKTALSRALFSNGERKDLYSTKEFKVCTKCNIEKPIGLFYRVKKKTSYIPHSYCIECSKKGFKERDNKKRMRIKTDAIGYKGGCCQICKYSKCISALEFHHIDPSTKKFSISQLVMKDKSVTLEEIKSELDKCALLCANCHREVHAGLIKL